MTTVPLRGTQSENSHDESLRFRRATGRIPSPVAIITGMDGESRLGMTVSTLTPASVTPPMVMFFASTNSKSARSIIATGAFGANVLGRSQEGTCYQFAGSAADKFADIEIEPFPSGIPMLVSCALSLDCLIESTVIVGDHVAVFGSVSWYQADPTTATSLVFYRSKLARLDSASGRHIPTESLQWW